MLSVISKVKGNSSFEKKEYVIVIDDKILSPIERRNYLGLEGRIRGVAVELGLDGNPTHYWVKFSDYKRPIKMYPECLKKIKKKKR